jgi:hypothetical protein
LATLEVPAITDAQLWIMNSALFATVVGVALIWAGDVVEIDL